LMTFLAMERPRFQGEGWLRTTLFDLFVAAGFAALVLRHQRIAYEFAMVAGFVLARWSAPVFARLTSRRFASCLVVSAALAMGAGAMFLQFSNARFGLGLDDRYYPQGLFRFVREHKLPGEVYVSDGWGGQWLWEFYPERRVFYDNRLEAYSFEFFRDQYQSIRYGEEGWQEKLDSFGVKALMLRYTTLREREFQNFQPNVRDLAFLSPRWKLVHWDDLGMIFVSAAAEGACADCAHYSHFNPDAFDARPGAADEDVTRELERAWAEMPSARACFVLALRRIESGDEAGALSLVAEGLAGFPDDPLLASLAVKLAQEEVR